MCNKQELIFLPFEVITEVLKHLSFDDLKTMMIVHPLFYNLITTTTQFNHKFVLTLNSRSSRDKQYDINIIRYLSRSDRKFKSICISDQNFLDDDLHMHTENLIKRFGPNIEELKILNVETNINFLADLLSMLPNLENICMKMNISHYNFHK